MTPTGVTRRVEKPWGHEEILVETELYRLKVLVIRAGEETSLQFHRRKHESLYVDGGTIDLVIGVGGVVHADNGESWPSLDVGTETRRLAKGAVVVIPPGKIHQFRAANGQGARLIEVSNAVGDDDIERLSDRYASLRGDPP